LVLRLEAENGALKPERAVSDLHPADDTGKVMNEDSTPRIGEAVLALAN